MMVLFHITRTYDVTGGFHLHKDLDNPPMRTEAATEEVPGRGSLRRGLRDGFPRGF